MRQAHLTQLPLKLRFLLQQALQRRRSFPGHEIELEKKKVNAGLSNQCFDARELCSGKLGMNRWCRTAVVLSYIKQKHLCKM